MQYSIILLILITLGAKSQIAVGQWRDHLPYKKAVKLTQSADKIYCATEKSLYYYNKSDNSLESMSKVDGLSDVGVSSIAYSSDQDALIIAYTNTNIDIVKGNTIYNLPDIKRKQITGNKSINDVIVIDDYAYLSCGFGIVVIDIFRTEIKDTYIIGPNATKINVNEITYNENYFYAATSAGIYYADRNSPNLVDYQNWYRINNIPNFNQEINTIEYHNNGLYYCYDSDYNKDSLYYYDYNSVSYVDSSKYKNVVNLSSYGNKLAICMTYGINILENNTEIANYYNNLKPKHALYDSDNNLWIADNSRGLLKAISSTNHKEHIINSPNSSNVVDIDCSGGKLYAVAGGYDGSYGNIWRNGEVNRFITEEWKSFLSGEYKDIVNVAVNPSDASEVFTGCWNAGVLEFKDGSFVKAHNETNSSLESIFTNSRYIRIGGLCFDENQNLWVTNCDVDNAFSVREKNGTWHGLSYGDYFSNGIIGDIIATQNGHKWVVLPRGGGLFLFDDKGTYDDMNDDDFKIQKILDKDNQTITNDIYSIAEDQDGIIWIGTNKGIVVYYNPENAFEGSNFYAQKVIIDESGSAQYLLESEKVTAIAIDGANRKWFGTSKAGAFLMSEDGTEQIKNFNEENSPLLSNNITDIGINHESGEVFFGTDKGLISYKGDATEGKNNFNDVYVYPNPVKETYNGIITITNLVANADVKISDISGNVVYDTIAKGGQASWNGKDFNGNRVHTGVYLVFCTNEDGSETTVAKILFIN